MIAHRAVVAACAATLLLATAACGSGEEAAAGGKVQVMAAFYPLAYATEQIGGEHVEVTNLTPAGAEPHDLELTPQQILEVTRADALVHLSGFSPSVDDAAERADDEATFDVRPHARLDLGAGDEGGDAHGQDAGGHHGHGHEGHGHEGHDHGGVDPHFWLDPTRYADVATAIADHLAAVDPAHADEYRQNARDFGSRLTALDKDLRQGLDDCRERDLVTGHAAFGYFADRYGFEQVAIAGLDPHSEPSAAALADLVEHVEEADIDTVYAETLVPSDVADTIARDAGASVATLDPIAGVTDESAGDDYFEIMRSNLATLREGQQCS